MFSIVSISGILSILILFFKASFIILLSPIALAYNDNKVEQPQIEINTEA